MERTHQVFPHIRILHGLFSVPDYCIRENPGSKQVLHSKRVTILVHSGCYNWIPQTRLLVDDRDWFLTVLEAAKFKTKVLAGSMSGERLIHRKLPFCCDFKWWRGKGSSFQDLLPILGGSVLMTKSPPKGPHLQISDWRSGFFFFFFLIYFFLLKDSCVTEFCCFLSNLSMNQP